MAIILQKKYTLSLGKLIIESAKLEEAEKIISFIKEVETETNFLMRESGEFNMSLENERKFIESKINNNKEIFLTAKVNGNIVGTLGFATSPLNRYQHKGQFGISISKKFWGYGIGSKLIETMISWADNNNFVKICLEVDSNNRRAMRLYQKFGFEQEGILKLDKHLETGIFIDSIVMARINIHNLNA